MHFVAYIYKFNIVWIYLQYNLHAKGHLKYLGHNIK